MAEVGWVLEHLDDIASDMHVFHGVRDIRDLDGPTFLRLAWRLPAYDGVMRARALAEEQDNAPAAPAAGGGWAPEPAGSVNPGTRTTLQADPMFSGLFDFG